MLVPSILFPQLLFVPTEVLTEEPLKKFLFIPALKSDEYSPSELAVTFGDTTNGLNSEYSCLTNLKLYFTASK